MSFKVFTVRSCSPWPVGPLNPPLARLDGDSKDSSFTTILTMPSPFGITISAATGTHTNPPTTVWSIMVAPAEYQQLCDCLRGLLPGGTCQVQIYYRTIPNSEFIVATKLETTPGPALLSIQAELHHIADTTQDILQVVNHDSTAVVHELKQLNALVGQVLLRLPEGHRPNHGDSDAPSHRQDTDVILEEPI